MPLAFETGGGGECCEDPSRVSEEGRKCHCCDSLGTVTENGSREISQSREAQHGAGINACLPLIVIRINAN